MYVIVEQMQNVSWKSVQPLILKTNKTCSREIPKTQVILLTNNKLKKAYFSSSVYDTGKLAKRELFQELFRKTH